MLSLVFLFQMSRDAKETLRGSAGPGEVLGQEGWRGFFSLGSCAVLRG